MTGIVARLFARGVREADAGALLSATFPHWEHGCSRVPVQPPVACWYVGNSPQHLPNEDVSEGWRCYLLKYLFELTSITHDVLPGSISTYSVVQMIIFA